MRKYKVVIDTDALQDIQLATDWYNEQKPRLGTRFQKQVKAQINSLRINPYAYRIRYADVRCMLVKKFPFLIHFILDDSFNVVKVFALTHTSRNPKIWE